ncbi:hypothetical protein [Haloferula sp. BvORR071]|uniref:hypothetical protein n=1 Tax=Haloferula sp. BvORR071 TaxID=1396141 RepID=UPI00054FBF61|nr:hypothetical protein [Haloferula sp. BvORR071]
MKRRSFLPLLACMSALPALAEDDPKKTNLFYSPLSLFKDCIVPVMEKHFSAECKNTLRGFILRGDSSNAFLEADQPSSEGLLLSVAVRDADEIPAFEDKNEQEGKLTVRSVRFPAFPPGQKPEEAQGLAVYLTYGANADKEALAAIEKCIDAIKKTTGQK